MGIVNTILPQSKNMKLLLVVALVAGVHGDADTDPQLLLAGYPLVYGAHHVVHTPVVKAVEVKPVTYAGHTYPYVFGHGLPLTGAAPAEAERKKREAEPEADPEADPWYLTYGYHAPV